MNRRERRYHSFKKTLNPISSSMGGNNSVKEIFDHVNKWKIKMFTDLCSRLNTEDRVAVDNFTYQQFLKNK